MTEFRKLDQVISKLDKAISKFPIGAVSVEDFKPIEEKIEHVKESLKCVNSKSLILKAHQKSKTDTDVSESDNETVLNHLREATAKSQINKQRLQLSLHSHAIQAILSGEEGTPELKERVYVAMRKLFTLNDQMMSVQEQIESEFQEQLNLKHECQVAIFNYKKFLKEQEEIRNKKLQETNPEMAKMNESLNKTLQRVNLMKKLITSFVSVSHRMLQNPLLQQMLEDHRELITLDTVSKMSKDSAENEA